MRRHLLLVILVVVAVCVGWPQPALADSPITRPIAGFSDPDSWARSASIGAAAASDIGVIPVERPDLIWLKPGAIPILYYNPSATGSFRFTYAGSGDTQSVSFAELSEPGFTGPALNDAAAPYESNLYTFTTSNATSASAPDIEETTTTGTSNYGVGMSRDVTSPSVTITAPAAGTISPGDPVSTEATDTFFSSGVASVNVRLCPGSSCTWATGTPIGTTFPVVSDGEYTIIARATDQVSNVGETTRTVTVDSTPPATGTLSAIEGARPDLQHFNAATSTLFYRPAGSGSVEFNLDPVDAADIASVDFPALAQTGFSGSASQPTTSPFRSSSYAFDASNSTAPPPLAVTLRDAAGNATPQTINFSRDTSAPTPSFTAPAASSRIATGTAVRASANDGAGIESVEFRRCAGTCTWDEAIPIGAPDTATPFQTTWPAGTPDGPHTILTHATDRVGNVGVSVSRSVTVDNTGPAIGTLGATAVARPDLQYFRAGDSTLFLNPAASGSLRLQASPSDPAGIARVDFPSVSGGGFTGSSSFATASPFLSSPYTFSASESAPAPVQISATDSLGNVTSKAVSVAIDTVAPSGGTISYPDGELSGSTVAVVAGGASDGGSGLSTTRIERNEAALTDGSCGPWSGSWSTVAASDATTSPGHCYRYRLVATDRVGNTQTATSPAVVRRTTAPAPGPGPSTDAPSGGGAPATPANTPPPAQPPTAKAPTTQAPPTTAPRPKATITAELPFSRSPLRLARKSITVDRKGAAKIPFRCVAKRGRCKGRFAIYLLEKVKPKRGKASIAKTRKVRIGTGRFDAKAGRKGTIKAVISRRGRRRILRKRSARCRISVNAGGKRFGGNITLKRPRPQGR